MGTLFFNIQKIITMPVSRKRKNRKPMSFVQYIPKGVSKKTDTFGNPTNKIQEARFVTHRRTLN